jgi:diacylglycerol kinase (ATP)
MNAPASGPEKIVFIINPIAGGKEDRNVKDQINNHLDPVRWTPDFNVTRQQGDAGRFCAHALSNGAKAVVAVGGDGTIHEVAAKLTGTSIPLGIIPTGSGNGLARHLGIPLHVKGAVELINRKQVRQIDTGRINGKPFISLAGVGFDALVANKFAGSRQRGFITYLRIVLREYLTYQPERRLVVTDDGNETITTALLIVCANAGQFGYNIRIAPSADLSDGQLDLCILEKPPLLAAPVMVMQLLTGRIANSRYATMIRCGKMTIRSEDDQLVNLDGEAVHMGREFLIETVPASLRIMSK